MSRDCYLVTGASSGLGELFAIRLAEAGHDVVLVARRLERLEVLARRLRDEYGVSASPVSCDLTEPGAVQRLMLEIEDMGITVTHLINNAGFGLRGGFVEMDEPSQAHMIDHNCRVLMEMSHAVLPSMVAAGRGGILNVASLASFQPGPWMAVYYASKAFVLRFSEALHEEVIGRGVAVACLCPEPTQTEFFDVAGMKDSFLSTALAGEPEHVVQDGLRALEKNRAVVVSGGFNAVMAFLIRFTPRSLARVVAGRLQKARGA